MKMRQGTALVLGGGGLVGAAFEAGVLAGIEAAWGWDAREAELIVGTSAGSHVGTLIRAGVSPGDLLALQTHDELSASGQALADRIDPLPPVPPSLRRPRLRIPSRMLMTKALRHPWQTRAGLLTAVIPTGPFDTAPYANTLRRLVGSSWPDQSLWVTASHLPLGDRVVFGREGYPECDVVAAIAASCAVPGLFVPVDIGGERYVDGGIHSPTNADLLVDEAFDRVVIVSPMSVSRDAIRQRRLNPMRLMCRAMLATEVRKLRKSGAEVIVFEPTVDDLRAMGLNALNEMRCPRVSRTAYDSVIERARDRTRKAVGGALAA